MLEATFQTRVPFLGQMREPGEVVGGDDLANVSRTVLDALVAQKVILLNDSSAPGPHDPEAVGAPAGPHGQAGRSVDRPSAPPAPCRRRWDARAGR